MFFQVGDPGRAALEIREGPPVVDIGRADVEMVSAHAAGIRIRAATVRGLLHRRQGTPRQDAFSLAQDGTPDAPRFVVASVCDGVGSRANSQEAADLVSSEVVRLAALGLPWEVAFSAANDSLISHVDLTQRPMATTVVALRVRRESDLWIGTVAWIGDSSAWHLDLDGSWDQIGGILPDDDDGYHSGSVSPLPSADGACEQRDFELSGGAIFLLSDGLANPLKWSSAVQESLAKWWSQPPDHFTFAAQVDFAMKGHVDDRTAVGLWFEPSSTDLSAAEARSGLAQDVAEGDVSRELAETAEVDPVSKNDLGSLELIGEGNFGVVYRLVRFRLGDDPTPLAYKEFTKDVDEQVRSASRAVAFRDSLSSRDQEKLDTYTAWPRAMVEGGHSGLVMPLIPPDYFRALTDDETGLPVLKPLAMNWLVASANQINTAGLDLRDVSRRERLDLLAQLCRAVGYLHEQGWVFGDVSLSSAVFALNPPRLMLVDCDAAAPESDGHRRQGHTPFDEPPECLSDPTRLEDAVTDVYKLGLCILRCLSPGEGAATTRNTDRLAGSYPAEFVELVAHAIGTDRSGRPSARRLEEALVSISYDPDAI